MRGRLLVNGNMGSLSTYAQRIRPFLAEARPGVLLITAAWGRGEYGEGAVREALNGVGVPSQWVEGHDRGIQNLCAWHAWQALLARRPDVAALDAELRAVEEATRRFYIEKTGFHADRIRRGARFARERLPGFRLGSLPRSERPLRATDGRGLLAWALTRELVHDLEDLVSNDARMLEALQQAEDMLAGRTGLRVDREWQAEKARLEERILSAGTLIFFGGDPSALLNALRFFDLGPALKEALRRGALVCTISAGSLVMCERIILYDDFNPDPSRREFRLFDQGFGLAADLQILPHCMDRIHTDDPDNLAYLARRFSSHLCVGLNEESFLLVDAEGARSVGKHDGVYVFAADGVKRRYDMGEALR